MCLGWYSYTLLPLRYIKRHRGRPTAKYTSSPYCTKCVFHVCSSPRTAVIAFLSQTPTHRWFDTVCLMHRVCVCVHINVCLRCLEHITAGKPNLPAIVLIKAVFLRLSLDGRQDQLHKTTGTQTGRLPQPHWHPLWTSPDFKRYSLSDYRVTDWVKKKKKRERKVYPSNHLYPNIDILLPLKHEL